MKIYAKQIPPEYQNGDYLLTEDEYFQTCVAIHGNDRLKGFNDNLIKDVESKIDDIIYIFDNFSNSNYKNFSAACNDILYQGTTHKPYSPRQVHKIKEFCKNYDYKNAKNNNCFILSLLTGREWDYITIRGCCQSEWNILYYTDDITAEKRDYIECVYFNMGSEWIIHDSETEPETADDVNGFTHYCADYKTDKIKQEIGSITGATSDDIILYTFSGFSRCAEYTIE